VRKLVSRLVEILTAPITGELRAIRRLQEEQKKEIDLLKRILQVNLLPVRNKIMSREEVEKIKYDQIWVAEGYNHVSPGETAIKCLPIIPYFQDNNVRTILDVGCGSGKAMKLLMSSVHGFAVYGFDISRNCLDEEWHDQRDKVLQCGYLWKRDDIKGVFDAIYCTDVLEHIPADKIDDALSNISSHMRAVGYLQIALFPDLFGQEYLGEPLHLIVEEPGWWLAAIERNGMRIERYEICSLKDGRLVVLRDKAVDISQDQYWLCCFVRSVAGR